MPSFTLADVHVRLQERQVLRGINVTFDEPRVGVIGANGSGKSTLARLLNGLVVPTRGRVTWTPETTAAVLDSAHDGAALRRQVGFIFSDPDAQIVMPTVAEDVAFSLRRQRLARPERDAKVSATLDRFGLSDHADHPAHLLSGGQKQLLALAAVMVTQPRTLVLDEPTTLLDLRNATRIRALLADLDVQLVLVSHDLELMLDTDRVLVLDDGCLVADADPGSAVAHYRDLMTP